MAYFYYFWFESYIFITILFLCIFLFLNFIINKFVKLSRNINDKHVLITGGSSGIGKYVAIEAAKLGANITIVARDKVKLESAVNDIRKSCIQAGQKVEYVSVDLSCNYENIQKYLLNAENELGPIYMLINCAGMAICGKLEDMSINDVHHLFNLNYMGTFHAIKALLINMKNRKEGHIVITASQAAAIGIFGFSVYSSTKFALRGLAESLYMEVKPYGISVTLALPPDTDTPGFANEEKSKPLETKLISETGGLYSPEIVGAQILKDALANKFLSTVGLESLLVTTVCCGMSPVSSLFELMFQTTFMGILRLTSFYYQIHFARIIKKCMKNEKLKKEL